MTHNNEGAKRVPQRACYGPKRATQASKPLPRTMHSLSNGERALLQPMGMATSHSPASSRWHATFCNQAYPASQIRHSHSLSNGERGPAATDGHGPKPLALILPLACDTL